MRKKIQCGRFGNLWKNKPYKKGLSFYYSVFSVKRTYASVIVKVLKNAEIEVFNFKTAKNGTVNFWVKNEYEKKVFAISKELWYNNDVIKKVGNKGLFYPVYQLFSRIGFLLGALFFVFSCVYISDYVLEFEYSGSGSVYKREVTNLLNNNGITLYSRVNDVDFDALSNSILSSSPNLSFVEVKKEGFRLIVYLVKKEQPKPLDEPKYLLTSSVCGEVVNLKIYRGTAIVNVGDFVQSGDVLVDGSYLLGDETVKSTVIATVTVREKKEFELTLNADGKEDNALILASQKFGEDYVKSNVYKTQNKNEYVYRVELFYDVVIIAT